MDILDRWPYLGLPYRITTELFGVDVKGATASIPTTMPLITVLAVVGGVLLFRGVLSREDSTTLVPALLGATMALAPGLMFAAFATRYLGDFLPPMLILASVGVVAIAGCPSRDGPGAAGRGRPCSWCSRSRASS